MLRLSSSSKRPLSVTPAPASSFSASAACTVPDDPGERREHPHHRAAGFLGFAVFREQAVVTGGIGLAQVEYAYLPVEAHGGLRKPALCAVRRRRG